MANLGTTAALVGLVLSATASQAQAWGAIGHRMISGMAMEMLPDDFPAFLQTEDVPFLVGELGREPDRWRRLGATHDKERNSGHWINLDDQGRVVGGPTLAELPDSREAYDTLPAMSAAPSTWPDTSLTASWMAGSSW